MRKFWWMQAGPLRDKADEGNEGGGDNKDNKGSDNNDDKGDKGPKHDKEVEAAVQLYKALNDPELGIEVIESLARRAGLLDRDKGSRRDDKDDKSDKKESRAAKLLKSKLGKDYEKFADTVGPAFDELLQEAIGELRNSSEVERQTEKWAGQVDKFMDSHELTEEIEDKMKELMEDSPPNVGRKGFDAQRYLARMYKNACEELDIEVPKTRSRSHKDRDDDDNTPRFVERDMPKNANLDDAVEAAIRGIRFRKK